MYINTVCFFLVILCHVLDFTLSFMTINLRSPLPTLVNGKDGAIRTQSTRYPLLATSPPNKLNGFSTLLPRLSYSPPTSFQENESIEKRRLFLKNFALSTMLLPVITSLPSPVSAFGYKTVENGPLIYGDDSIMSTKDHGSTSSAVQENLRYGVSRSLADKICCYNRQFAEMSGYFKSSSFEDDVRRVVGDTGGPVTFYDSVTGKALFRAPIGRSIDDFMEESMVHGWPSFRDDEVVWSNVRVLRSSGETVSTSGTHLGHNLPDQRGNRYCINLVSIAGSPFTE